MKTYKKTFASAFMALLAMTAASEAQTTLINSTTLNGSFELPVLAVNGKINDFAPGNVPDWLDTGATMVDSGVENHAAYAADGVNFAYLLDTDGGIFNLTTYDIQLGDTFTLTWDAKRTGSEADQTVDLFSSTDGAYDTASTLATYTSGLNGGANGSAYTSYSLSYTTLAGNVGDTIGVSIDNSDTVAGKYASFDNVVLTVTTVPEPASFALVATGGVLLFGLRLPRKVKV